jgi:hypothetical protein
MSNEMSTIVANVIAETLREFSVSVANLAGEEITTIERVVGFEETGLMTRDAGLVVTLANGSEFQVTVVLSKRADTGVDCIECGMWFADKAGCSAHLVAEHGWDPDDAN